MNASFQRNRIAFPNQSRASARKRAALGLAFAAILHTGCVALNIPSERHQDPVDHGGIFGPWENSARPGRVLQEILIGPEAGASDGHCDGGACQIDDSFNGDFSSELPPPPPEVPWPKYHPLPTRPVFGG